MEEHVTAFNTDDIDDTDASQMTQMKTDWRRFVFQINTERCCVFISVICDACVSSVLKASSGRQENKKTCCAPFLLHLYSRTVTKGIACIMLS
jgi:hypothetical protein